MLQFITAKSDKYTIAEEAQMVIEGGCQWIQVSEQLPEGTSMKDILLELKPLCEENGVFLMVESDAELAQEMRIHGVHLKKTDIKPTEARELLGPHAVIGIDTDSAAEILALKGLDIDYAVLDLDRGNTIDDIKQTISEVRGQGFDIHIVVKGANIDMADLNRLKQAGVSGFAMSRQILDNPEPAVATAEILAALSL